MEFSLAGALVGAFVATLVMTMMMRMAGAVGMTPMPAMELVTGSLLSGDERTAKRIGFRRALDHARHGRIRTNEVSACR